MIKNSTFIQAQVKKGDTLTISIEGNLDSTTTGKVWKEATEVFERASPKKLVIDASKIEYCDGSGIGLLVEFHRRQKQSAGEMEVRGLRPEFQQLLNLFDPTKFERLHKGKPRHINFPEQVGRKVFMIIEDARDLITFTGELVVAFTNAILHPQKVRWKNALFVAETAGVNALPIIALLSFLVGLIIAFQSAISMRQFGAQIFVANLVALSMLRELGPLMTAIILAGRSGSAFAAELGTMKIREEIDALITLGLDPVKFLVVIRTIASLVMTPLLTVYSNLLGLIGGCVVFLLFGFSLTTYVNQIMSAVTYVDFVGGLAKSFVFGFLIAGIGCFEGLRTKTGASAVGESATRAVVTGILLIIVADGIFSVIYYYLGI